ncbi:DgyrCDS3158 [Dimorphilus gyrociliatus]|uniref:DgyrCDS3158 n=1 Tax=Dimorphilus gyrociliatus TaxID=2664684 RepID=A0A7I8VHE6_9ANNE|nr:DgyrCDS3158 [Dimorphilus gyrociliatus]
MMVWSIGDEMAKNGHEVVGVLKSNFAPNKIKGYMDRIKVWTYEPLDNDIEKNFENSTRTFFKSCLNGAVNGKLVSQEEVLSRYVFNETVAMLNDRNLMEKIKRFKFDLAIMDGVILSRYHHIIPYHFDIPFITVTNFVSDPALRILALPSFSPNLFSPFTEAMTFSQRIRNLFLDICLRTNFLVQFLLPTEDKTLLRRYSHGNDVRSWEELVAKSKLFIVIRGSPLQYPTPVWPNVFQVYGLTLRPSGNLTDNLEKILAQNKEKKIVLVSFGSFGGLFPSSLAQLFLKSFGEMKNLLFIWSVKLDFPIVIPPNVKLFDWLPQKDLLANDKIVMFISHAGHNSQAEALYYGKPILCIPIFGDQEHNAIRVKYYGFGNFIYLHELSKDSLQERIFEIIHNNSMKTTVEKMKRFAQKQSTIDMQSLANRLENLLIFGDYNVKSYGQIMPLYNRRYGSSKTWTTR